MSSWFKIGGRNISFSAKPLSFKITTTDGLPIVVDFEDGGWVEADSGASSIYMYPGSLSFLGFSINDKNRIKEFESQSAIAVQLSDLSGWNNLEHIGLSVSVKTMGDIGDLPASLLHLSIEGNNNTTSGDIADLPSGLTRYNNRGQNTTSGDIADLPSGLTYYYNRGQNTTSGDIADLPSGLIYYYNHGQNTTSGDIADLPSGLTYYSNRGQNTTSGDIADLPSGLIYYYNYGQNTTSGDIADLPSGMTYYSNHGQNTTSGDIADLPSGLRGYSNYGQNTTSGDIADLPSGMTHYSNRGQNTTSGDIADLPSGIVYDYSIILEMSYSGGKDFPPNMDVFDLYSRAGGGLSSTEVDNLLIDLSKTSWASERKINISYNNAPRTSASDAAVALLQSKGVTVTTN